MKKIINIFAVVIAALLPLTATPKHREMVNLDIRLSDCSASSAILYPTSSEEPSVMDALRTDFIKQCLQRPF